MESQAHNILESGFYFGYFEEVYPIVFVLNDEDGILSGTVIFPLSGDSLLIEVDDLGERYLITEFDQSQAAIGYYFLKQEGTAWAGTWQNRSGDQFLNFYINKEKPITDLRERLITDQKNGRWIKKFSFLLGAEWNELLILRQAGRSASAVLSGGSAANSTVFLRGDCVDYHCHHLIFLNQSGEDDLLLEVHINENKLSGFYFYQGSETAFKADEKASFPLKSHYSFNQWFVFDALYPDLHPLMGAALEERISDWVSVAAFNWFRESKIEYPSVLDRFSARSYVWTEITHFNEDYVSGFIEWIHQDRSARMNSFLFDISKEEWYWEEDFNSNGLSPAFWLEEEIQNIDGVFVVVPGGWQQISPLDQVSGREYIFHPMSNTKAKIPRSFRNWFRL